MKRYIKINLKSEIVDIFCENVKANFDGTEILFDTVMEQDVHVNGKCIFDEYGFPNFSYINNHVAPTTIYDAQRQIIIQQLIDDAKRKNILSQLTKIDADSMKPLRSITTSAVPAQADKDALLALENQAKALQTQLPTGTLAEAIKMGK